MAKAGRIRVGTSGWVYKDWRGRLYPAELPTALQAKVVDGQENGVTKNVDLSVRCKDKSCVQLTGDVNPKSACPGDACQAPRVQIPGQVSAIRGSRTEAILAALESAG